MNAQAKNSNLHKVKVESRKLIDFLRIANTKNTIIDISFISIVLSTGLKLQIIMKIAIF